MDDIIKKSDLSDGKNDMALLPLRDVVIYPHMIIPLFIGRNKSIKAVEASLVGNKKVVLISQREALKSNPGEVDIFTIGTISSILQIIKLTDSTMKVLIGGIQRGKILKWNSTEPYFIVNVEKIETTLPDKRKIRLLLRALLSKFGQFLKLCKKIPFEILTVLEGIKDPIRYVDTIAAHMPLKIFEKQKILEILIFDERVEYLMELLEFEIALFKIETRVRINVKKQMEKSQKEYYLNEQIKAIKKELGDDDDDDVHEIEYLIKTIEKAGIPKDAKEKVLAEVNKMKMMAPMSAEATVSRNYIDWILALPWKKRTRVKISLSDAEIILDQEHYGLEKVKERILEYLAVQKRVKKDKGPILCLVGPPGVGKTSLGKSIARAIKRKFIRMSLGGIRDEAEIRGHRKTYIGAMPGKIVQKIAKVGVRNPLFLLDEIDKIAMYYRGDPAAALLEVLDLEQNSTFNDHYLEIDFDLSDIMFIATANSLNMPAPLLDRMEIIRVAGYTEDEKINIATNYLIHKQLKNSGLRENELKILEESLLDIIRYYTREAGVRGLERKISELCRKVVKELLLDTSIKSYTVCVENLEYYLGVRKYRFGQVEKHDLIGQVIGLAWTESGGELLTIEAIHVPGNGKISRTGQLGDVMQESIQAAMTVVRSRAITLGISADLFDKYDVHIHVPEGATPKDGPSAGIGMCTAIVSMFTGIAVRRNVAMTGEITLRGQVLPIGGLKEKLLAAKRGGIEKIIIPNENAIDLKEIPKNIYEGMHIYPVHWIDEVFKVALLSVPELKNIDLTGGKKTDINMAGVGCKSKCIGICR